VHQAGHGGTLINGRKITREDLSLGDVLRVGNSQLRLEAVTPEEMAAAEKIDRGREEEAADKGEDRAVFQVARDGRKRPEEAEASEEPAAAGAGGGAETLPADVSEEARLLHLWRDRLTQLSGQALGHHHVGAVLGRGRCGVVFRADDQKTSQQVALKVLSPQFPQNDQELQRFARTLKGLLPLRHPNVVAVYGAGRTG